MHSLLAFLLPVVSLSFSPELPVEVTQNRQAQLIADAGDGRLDQFTLLESALIAASPGEDSSPCLGRFQQIVDELSCQLGDQDSEAQRAERIFEFLHKRVLVGRYQHDCFRIQTTLMMGDYNCLTATILFRCVGQYFGLPVITLAGPSHVLCRLEGPEPLNIEMTTPNGLKSAGGRATAFSEPFEREISDVQMLSRIYYNRGIAQAMDERFFEAATSLETSVQLDRLFQPATNNLLAVYNNWALCLCDDQEFVSALAVIQQAKRLAPGHPSVQNNERWIRQRLAYSGLIQTSKEWSP
jgi:tetratricopeptide (TPR) repeat protein